MILLVAAVCRSFLPTSVTIAVVSLTICAVWMLALSATALIVCRPRLLPAEILDQTLRAAPMVFSRGARAAAVPLGVFTFAWIAMYVVGIMVFVVPVAFSWWIVRALMLTPVVVVECAAGQRRPERISDGMHHRWLSACLTWLGTFAVALVIALIGLFVAAITSLVLPGPLHAVAFSLSITPAAVFGSMVGVAMWAHLTATKEEQGVHTVVPAPAQGMQASAAAAASIAGPALGGIVHPGAQAGDWVMVETPGMVTIRANWCAAPGVDPAAGAGAPPLVIACDQAGTWQQVASDPVPGAVCSLLVEHPGWWWIGLASREAHVAQAWRVETWLPDIARVA